MKTPWPTQEIMDLILSPEFRSFATISSAYKQAIEAHKPRTFKFECSGKEMIESWAELAFEASITSMLIAHVAGKRKCNHCLKQLNELYDGRFSFYQTSKGEIITVVELGSSLNPEKRLKTSILFHSHYIFKKNGDGTVSVLKDRMSKYPKKTITEEDLKKELLLQ